MMISMLVVTAAIAAGAAGAGGEAALERLLERFVDDSGQVDYAGLKADRAALDAAVEGIARERASASRPEKERLAFWLNAYNVLTLKLIVDHYPIQASAGKQKVPASSIQQIPDPWKRRDFTVMGRKRSLDEIEHEVIRREFREPRVHWALVCAAVSCPPLRREPYRGDALDRQLDDQARRFFSDARNLRIDRERNEVWVSRIIQWFADDFAAGGADGRGRAGRERAAVLAAATPYVDAATREYLESADYALRFYEYDWTLNEQTK